MKTHGSVPGKIAIGPHITTNFCVSKVIGWFVALAFFSTFGTSSFSVHANYVIQGWKDNLS